MNELLRDLAQSWPAIAGLVAAIVFIVRMEVGLRNLRKDFDHCRLAHGAASEDRIKSKIDANHDETQTKIEALLAKVGEISGKLSVIERRVNGDSR